MSVTFCLESGSESSNMAKTSTPWKSNFPSESEKKEKVASNVQFLREELGLDRKALGDFTGLSLSAVHKLESNEMENPRLYIMDRIANLFGVTIDDLVHTDVTQESALERAANRLTGLGPEIQAREDETADRLIVKQIDELVILYARQGYFRKN